ncbi:MAG: anti-sigma factor family protein [Pseudomonadota bacterium]
MTHSDAVTELDLLAYADGQLDHDISRRAHVEAAIRRSPELGERLARLQAQNAALRQAYGHVSAEPTPERLLAALEPRPAATWSGALRVAAVVALTAAAGLAGWRLADMSGGEGWSAARFADRSRAEFVAEDAAASLGGAEMAQGASGGAFASPLGRLRDEVSIRLKAPDLSAFGFELVDKRAVEEDDDDVVRLDYRRPDGTSFSLFVTPRWENRPSGLTHAERGGVAMAYWLDGPLASTIVARMPGEELRDLAQAVRNAMRSGGEPPARLDVDAPARDAPESNVMADSHSPLELDDPGLASPQLGMPASAPN